MSASTDQTENESPPAGTDIAVGMERYFQFLRQQMDLQREFTMTWAAAVTSMSSALLGQWQTVEHIVAGHADQIAERAHGAERVTRGIVRAGRDRRADAGQPDRPSAGTSAQQSPGRHPGGVRRHRQTPRRNTSR